MAVQEKSPQPEQYDTSKIGFTPPKLLGHKIRLETKTDEKGAEYQEVHIDTTVGKFFRKLGGATYADSDVKEAKAILVSIASKKDPAVHDAAVIRAAVKTLVLEGAGRHEAPEYITGVFEAREKSLHTELMKKPDIRALLANLMLDTSRKDFSLGDQLRLLKDYGVDLKEQTLDHGACSKKLADSIAEKYTPFLGDVLMPRGDLEDEIQKQLADIKSGKKYELPGPGEYASEKNPHALAYRSLDQFFSSETVAYEAKVERFGIAPPAVQLRYLTDAANMPEVRFNVIDDLFAKMPDRQKNSIRTRHRGSKVAKYARWTEKQVPEDAQQHRPILQGKRRKVADTLGMNQVKFFFVLGLNGS